MCVGVSRPGRRRRLFEQTGGALDAAGEFADDGAEEALFLFAHHLAPSREPARIMAGRAQLQVNAAHPPQFPDALITEHPRAMRTFLLLNTIMNRLSRDSLET